jgi:hypothetical protein
MAWQELFSTDIGLLSVFTIAFIIGWRFTCTVSRSGILQKTRSTRMADSPGAREFFGRS